MGRTQRRCRCWRRALRHRADVAGDGRQIAAPALVRELCALPAAAGPTVLAVDRDLPRVFDIDDATKVKLAADRVVEIGKGLRALRRGRAPGSS